MGNLIEVNNLCKKFKDFELKNVSFCVPEGSIVGLIGENASGKSTTMRLILDLFVVDSGEIKIFGKPHNSLSKAEKEQIGVLLGAFPTFQFFRSRKKYSKISSILFDAWDSELFDDLCQQLGVPENLKGASEGTVMKLSIAQMLSHGAKLLVLDEPVNGLDPLARENFRDTMREFVANEKNAVLISSHILSDLEQICDYILFIHKGEVFLFDTKENLADKFVILKCDKAEFQGLPKNAVFGFTEIAFGVEVLLMREFLPKDMQFEIPTLEQMMIFMLKNEEENKNEKTN